MQYSEWPDQTGLLGNIAVDPHFVNAVGDFHLQSDSPAIDAGTFVGGLNFDFDGILRPHNVLYDIGAYEYDGIPLMLFSPFVRK